MDLVTLEGTSVLAIKAVYQLFWEFIPEKYRLTEGDSSVLDLEPFYDPKLTFDNRLQYKLVKNGLPNRETPWFVITWNTDKGLLKSTLSSRRFQTTSIELPSGNRTSLKFINADMDVTLGIATNSMAAMFALQENILLKMREKMYVMSEPHSVVGPITVALDDVDSDQNKLDRDKGTLAYLFVRIKVDFPVFGYMKDVSKNIIKEINLLVKDYNDMKLSFDKINANDLTEAELEQMIADKGAFLE